MRGLWRYLLFQIPSWLVAAVLVAGLKSFGVVSAAVALLLLALWIVKDLALYPLLRPAYDTRSGSSTELLVGCQAVAVDRLAPRGFVRIRGELWRAEADPLEEPIAPGQAVRVKRVSGLTLTVSADKAVRHACS